LDESPSTDGEQQICAALAQQPGQGGGFVLTKGRFAFLFKYLSDAAPSGGDNYVIQVNEAPAEFSGQSATDGRLAGAHEADERDAISFEGVNTGILASGTAEGGKNTNGAAEAAPLLGENWGINCARPRPNRWRSA